jgi:hypothetical protein
MAGKPVPVQEQHLQQEYALDGLSMPVPYQFEDFSVWQE